MKRKTAEHNIVELLKKTGLFNPDDPVCKKISLATQAIEKAKEALGRKGITTSEVINYWTNENS